MQGVAGCDPGRAVQEGTSGPWSGGHAGLRPFLLSLPVGSLTIWGLREAPSLYPFGFELVWGEKKTLCVPGARRRDTDRWEAVGEGELRAENMVLLPGGPQPGGMGTNGKRGHRSSSTEPPLQSCMEGRRLDSEVAPAKSSQCTRSGLEFRDACLALLTVSTGPRDTMLCLWELLVEVLHSLGRVLVL